MNSSEGYNRSFSTRGSCLHYSGHPPRIIPYSGIQGIQLPFQFSGIACNNKYFGRVLTKSLHTLCHTGTNTFIPVLGCLHPFSVLYLINSTLAGFPQSLQQPFYRSLSKVTLCLRLFIIGNCLPQQFQYYSFLHMTYTIGILTVMKLKYKYHSV